jgi:hypothetical protein
VFNELLSQKGHEGAKIVENNPDEIITVPFDGGSLDRYSGRL